MISPVLGDRFVRADSLAALAKETLGHDPFSGAVLVFRSRSADRVKILVWDGSGWCWFGNGWNRARSNGRRSPTG
jgi:transposase